MPEDIRGPFSATVLGDRSVFTFTGRSGVARVMPNCPSRYSLRQLRIPGEGDHDSWLIPITALGFS
jgi:hypothetical protein